MKAIFYDLETSDKNFTGQILNYSFILVNEKLEVEDELSGTVRLSRLQLPSAGAILANRVHVIRHQREAKDSEAEAMRRIYNFFAEITGREQYKVLLIGYNSSRFDLPYLRTSLIRNGFGPYFGGRLAYRDLLFGVRKLSVSAENFPRKPKLNAVDEEQKRLSLSLETITRSLGLLEGRQAHSSRDDVLLTIDLARELRRKFDFDVLGYEAYEASKLHLRSTKPVVVFAASPQYDLTLPDKKTLTPFALHDFDNRQAIWIDLAGYKKGKGRECLHCYSMNGNQFIVDHEAQADQELMELSAKAKNEFASTNVKNFYPCTTCDIEQHIYRLPMKDIDALSAAIHGVENGPKFQSKDGTVLLVRYKLANFKPSNGAPNQGFLRTLASYAKYRYGGRMQMAKTLPEKMGEEGNSEFLVYHPTFEVLLGELETLAKTASMEDLKLLEALREYYVESEVCCALAVQRTP